MRVYQLSNIEITNLCFFFKILTVKIIIPDHLKNNLNRFIHDTFFKQGIASKARTDVLDRALDEAYNKKRKCLSKALNLRHES